MFDLFGMLASSLFGFRRTLKEKDFKKILVMRIDAIGDLIMTRPALSALRQKFPHAQIDLLVSNETVPLLEDGREARNVYGMASHWFKSNMKCGEICTEKKRLKKLLKAENYDLAIDFRGDLRNIFFLKSAGIHDILGYGITGGEFLLSGYERYDWNAHQVLVNLQLLRRIGIQTLPQIYPLTYSAVRKERFWKTSGQKLNPKTKFRMTVHSGAGLASKCWPQSSFHEVINKALALEDVEIVLIGTTAEKDLFHVSSAEARIVDLRGTTDLSDLPILFDACNLHVGNDSGPAHIAAAQGIPVISLFSGTNAPEVWKPWGSRDLTVFKFHDPDDIKPQQVFEKIERIYRSYHAG